MKQMTFLNLLLAILLLTTGCQAQNKKEPAESYENLAYSDTTIRQLKFIVDSLNLKFRVCELNRVYQSLPQARAHFVRLNQGNMLAARRDMAAGMAFEDFLKKYPQAWVDSELLVVKFKYQNYEGENVVKFTGLVFGDKSDRRLYFSKNLSEYDKPLQGKWLVDYSAKTSYSEESLEAFYFLEELARQPVPEPYARMIQYSDCMVDTSAQVFLSNYEERWGDSPDSRVSAFMDYVHRFTQKPDPFADDKFDDYEDRYTTWDSLRMIRLDSLKKVDTQFLPLLQQAVAAALENGGSNDEFEEYVHRYYSAKTALQLKRSRRVIGSCSQDDSPRIHAFNIAKLSAETVNWEIFLRSHLDIMNDRFERVSDGSYAWAGRKTYIRELEVLDINVLDLLLGISFRMENPSDNHYYGSIGRLGRALSETEKPEATEAKMAQIIGDKQLDDYNRVLMYYLFSNYIYHLEDKAQQKASRQRLALAVQTMPRYLARQMEKDLE